ncbi:hypothetical protein PN497_02285 [Sphaerospermopsis kisseleviana CS-549]|uniref:Teneurin-like YD-shell domain-containing protein n=1 Tax=Sphaerospermopsis kisseleviana CS-549 TaxID=3021783 RepID=A0ABT4ZN76_9CYAN|nr:RHS repeat-associated core domain-containing protein [Sphaerospermopsis kisseleviana]MDB9440212.1 hypothetical protein [Sphaerospermopsis kisseleviana CS-549]
MYAKGTADEAKRQFEYDLAGNQTAIIDENSNRTTFEYDALNRLVKIIEADPDGNGPLTSPITTYSYDADGNLISTTDAVGNVNQNTYDKLNRLIENIDTLNQKTSYSDGEGNRTKRTEIATGQVTEYVWDYRNRLTKVSFKDAAGNEIKTVEYTYDVNNRRLAKSIDADGSGAATPTVERYVYDGQNIALTFDGNGTQTHRYFYGTGVDQILADENGQGQVLWTLTDNQGTVRDLVDGTGTVQNHITYDSFGKITSQTNPVFTTIFAYTGREFDGETGQYYYRARYYDQNVGRFIGEDPIGFSAGDANLYRYVGNSPTNANDPSGLIIDTAADTIFIGYDIYKIVKDNIFGNCDNLGENLLALGADVAGAFIPFATGGGAGVRAAKAAERALEAARATERAAEAARASDRLGDAAREVPQITVNKKQGDLGEQFIRDKLNNHPKWEVVGEQIRINTPENASHRNVDIVIRNKETGELRNLEVKTGGATRDARQVAKDQEIARGQGTTFSGKRANDAGFANGTPTGPIPTYVVRPRVQ